MSRHIVTGGDVSGLFFAFANCSRPERRPDVRLYRLGDRAGIMVSGSDLGYGTRKTQTPL